MQKSMLLWSSAHQLDYIPASPTLGCKYPPSRGARLQVSRVRQAHPKSRQARSQSSSWRGKGEVPRGLRQPPSVVSLLRNCEPSLKECQGRVAVSGSCTTAACPCLELVQSIRHWLREETGSTHRESCLIPGQDPEHQTCSHSHSPDLDLIQMF